MCKKMVLFLMCLLPLGVFSQEHGVIAHVNTSDIFNQMPDLSKAESDFAKYHQQLEAELKAMQEEFQKKYNDLLQAQDSLPETIKARRMQDVKILQDRLNTFMQDADQLLANKKEELQAPIMQKISDAIKAVGDENGYLYVLEDNMGLRYISPKAVNITAAVKKKLGIAN